MQLAMRQHFADYIHIAHHSIRVQIFNGCMTNGCMTNGCMTNGCMTNGILMEFNALNVYKILCLLLVNKWNTI